MNIIAVVQARCGSSRLPRKILQPAYGQVTLLEAMLERMKKSKLTAKIIVATTTNSEDDTIENICRKNDFSCFRGHHTDLLDRHYRAAAEHSADAVAKIPSDCPLIDHRIIDKVFGYFAAGNFDYVSNLHPATYPDGNDVEVFSIDALRRAWQEAEKPFEREHTTPYFWENPEKYILGNVTWESGIDYSMTHRFTIDYPEDYAFIRRVFDELYPTNPDFSLEDILNLCKQKPEVPALNAMHVGVNWYRNHLADLKTVSASETRMSALDTL